MPAPKAQRNFTDPESRIMKDGATKGFVQAYNAQAAVDGEAQVIVAAAVTQEANDKRQLAPMYPDGGEPRGEAGVPRRTRGTSARRRCPTRRSPGSTCTSRRTGRSTGSGRADRSPGDGTAASAMRAKLADPAGRAVYAARKAIVEPVFGQIKEARGFRRFSLRGRAKVRAEWDLICLTHNLLKLFRAGWVPQTA